MVVYKQDPWGEERADLRAGVVASTIANCNRGKNSKLHKPQDFMPMCKSGGVPQTQEEWRNKMDGIMSTMNARRGAA